MSRVTWRGERRVTFGGQLVDDVFAQVLEVVLARVREVRDALGEAVGATRPLRSERRHQGGRHLLHVEVVLAVRLLRARVARVRLLRRRGDVLKQNNCY